MRGQRRPRRWTWAAVALTVLVAAFGALTVRLFVVPARGMPSRVSAILMPSSTGDPLTVALRLARQGRASFLLISLGTVAAHNPCPRPVPGVKLICFHPAPATTQGEAEYAARIAAAHHWRSIVVATITPQASRARLRLERCFAGHVYVMTGPVPAAQWPYQLVYEWGATIKALVLQRGC